MASSKNILLKEYKDLAKEKWVKIDVSLRHVLLKQETAANIPQMDEEDIYRWNLALIVLNPDSLYYGGYFKAQINFPRDYPYKPPGRSHHFEM
jgi:ubiquitin-conjugating enzyme E2 R